MCIYIYIYSTLYCVQLFIVLFEILYKIQIGDKHANFDFIKDMQYLFIK